MRTQVQKIGQKDEIETEAAMTTTGIADIERVTIEDIIANATKVIGTAGAIRTEPREVRIRWHCLPVSGYLNCI